MAQAVTGSSREVLGLTEGRRGLTVKFSGTNVDATCSEAAGQWTEALVSHGQRMCVITGQGVFDNESASDYALDFYAHMGWIVAFRVEIRPKRGGGPGFAVEGPFQITKLDRAGEYNGEVQYDVTLESAGVITRTELTE